MVGKGGEGRGGWGGKSTCVSKSGAMRRSVAAAKSVKNGITFSDCTFQSMPCASQPPPCGRDEVREAREFTD